MGTLAALWGASYMFIEIAIEDLDDVFIVFARTLLGALILAPVAVARGAFAPVRGRLGWLVLIAVIQIAGPFVLITSGQHHVTSSMAGILVASAPIYIAIITAFAAKSERLGGWGVVGIVIGIVGVALLFGVDLGGDSDAVFGGLAILLLIGGVILAYALWYRRGRDLTVGKLMRRNLQTVRADARLSVFRREFPLGSAKRVVAVDDAGRYAGLVPVPEAHSEMPGAERVADLLEFRDQMLLPAMNAKEAMAAFDATEADALVVVDDPETRRVVGLLSEAHLLRRYGEELDRRRHEETGLS